MGPVAYFSFCLLGCLIFNPSLEGIGATCCPNDWIQYKDFCYGFFSDKMTWAEAEVQCQYHHKRAHLASILNEVEGNTVARYISMLHSPTNHIWIGLHNPQQNRQWRWTDSSLYSYSAWNAGEPNNQGGFEYCTQLQSHTGFKNWNDAPCNEKNGYVCKYEL